MSSRRSGTRRQRKPTLLLDENTQAQAIAADLRRFDCWHIERQADQRTGEHQILPSSSGDDDILSYCIERDWCLLTCDDMRYTPKTVSRDLLDKSRIFKLLRSGEMSFIEMRSTLVVARHQIVRVANNNSGNFFAHINNSGHVRIMRRAEDPTVPTLTSAQQKTVRKYGIGALGRQ